MRTCIFLQLASLALAFAASAAVAPTDLLNSLKAEDPNHEVVERGQDFAVLKKITSTNDAAGNAAFVTNQVTLLANSLHYFTDGEWKPSQDIIEPFPGGAVARHGPYKTVFSPELKAEAVFDIETPEGQRIRGGVRAIQLTDSASGKSLVLATVKGGASGEVVPPNQVVYRSGFDGLDADVLFVWQHNAISQNVILKRRPVLPDGMDPATTRIEVVSELVECPEPVLNTAVHNEPNKPDLRDDVTIRLGSMLAVRGRAFPVSGAKALVLTGDHLAEDNGVGVAKEFHQLEDGRKFIIESVGWEEIQPMLKNLTAAKLGVPSANAGGQLANARAWPDRVPALMTQEPLQMASLAYQHEGFLVDLDLSGSVSSYTFLSGTTYYIPQSFYIAGTATTTFQPGCTIKYGSDAWLLLHCPFSFPSTGQLMPVLTSKDDDLFGAMIPGSTHNPTYMARQALLVYYVLELTTEVKNVLIRWANKGIEYLSYPGTGGGHTIRDALFQRCSTGINANTPDAAVSLVNVKKCNVTTPFVCNCDGGSGSMTDDCGPLHTLAAYSGVASGEVIDGQGVLPVPDTMGAIGPNHFVELLNGVIVVFSRTTGARVAQTGIDSFFRHTSGSTTYPRPPAMMNDPRIIYDHRSGRWIACAKENASINENQAILAISKGSDPVGNPNLDWKNLMWDRFLLQVAEPNTKQDFPTLGTDDNGVYVAVNHTSDPAHSSLVAIKKKLLLANPPALVATYFRAIPYQTLQPAVNFDFADLTAPGWIVAHRLFYYEDIVFARITWTGGVPSLSAWTTLVTPGFGVPQRVPSKGSPNLIDVLNLGGALEPAAIRNAQLWTCRTIGVNSSGGATGVDRDACEWLHLSLSGSSASVIESGRVFDSTTSNPRFYFHPSIMVNSRGDAVMGFSGAGYNDYIGSFCAGRLSTDPLGQMSGVRILATGEAAYLDTRWGDYSHTTLDPNNSLAIWTVQQYARTPSSNWRTWIGEIMPITP